MRQAAGRARQSRFAILLGLIVVLGLAAAPAQAQTDTLPRVTLTSIDTANFPDISATVAVSGPNGLRVPGLTRGAFTLLENSSPVAIGQIAEEEIGLQIAFVVESSDIFLRRDINTITRLDYVKTAIINFAVGEGAGGNPYMKDVVDNVTILAPEGAIVQSSVVGGEIRNALDDAGAAPDEIDYINAHGTSTPENDKMEYLSLKAVLGDHLTATPISSNKSMIGHTLIAAGSVEAVFSLLTIRTGILPPTINYDDPDPEIPLDVVPDASRAANVRTVLSNSFGFGGQNVCVIFSGEPA